MKKNFSILLILLLTFSLIGCAAKKPLKQIAPPNKISNTDVLKQKALEKAAQDKLLATAALLKNPQLGVIKPSGAKTVFLTFDDGPSIGTLPLLAILDKYKIKATFFVTGMHYPQTKGLYSEIKKRGHVIGVHSMSHDYSKVYTSVDDFFNDLTQIEDIVYTETKDKPKLLRFPGGSNNHSSWKYSGQGFMKDQLIPEAIKRGYLYFDWNSVGNDAVAVHPSKNYIIKSVFTGIQNKQDVVVLLHDSNYKWTLDALPEIIERFKAEGYIFEILTPTSFRPQFTHF